MRRCNKHKRRIFFLISCVLEFVRSYAVSTTAWFLARIRDFFEFVCCKHNRLIFGTSSWLYEFVCCKHSRLFFGTSSWVRMLQTQPPDFWHEFVTSCAANTTALVSITNLKNIRKRTKHALFWFGGAVPPLIMTKKLCPHRTEADSFKDATGRMSWTGPSNMVELFHGSLFVMCLTIF